MIHVSYSSHFVKALKKRLTNKISERRFFQKLEVFIKNPFHPSLKTHKLSGDLEGYWSFSIEYDLRVIFYFSSNTKVVFADIGTHDEVY
jgi:addiction module RelE/StbE family toxin